MKLILTVFLFLPLVSCAKTKHTHDHIKKHKKYSGKTRGFVNLTIKKTSESGDTLELMADISPNIDMNSMTIEWKLPQGAKLANGNLSKIVSLNRGDRKVEKISIEKNSLKEGAQIFFFAYKMKNGERMGASSQYLFTEKNSETETAVKSKSVNKKKFLQ